MTNMLYLVVLLILIDLVNCYVKNETKIIKVNQFIKNGNEYINISLTNFNTNIPFPIQNNETFKEVNNVEVKQIYKAYSIGIQHNLFNFDNNNYFDAFDENIEFEMTFDDRRQLARENVVKQHAKRFIQWRPWQDMTGKCLCKTKTGVNGLVSFVQGSSCNPTKCVNARGLNRKLNSLLYHCGIYFLQDTTFHSSFECTKKRMRPRQDPDGRQIQIEITNETPFFCVNGHLNAMEKYLDYCEKEYKDKIMSQNSRPMTCICKYTTKGLDKENTILLVPSTECDYIDCVNIPVHFLRYPYELFQDCAYYFKSNFQKGIYNSDECERQQRLDPIANSLEMILGDYKYFCSLKNYVDYCVKQLYQGNISNIFPAPKSRPVSFNCLCRSSETSYDTYKEMYYQWYTTDLCIDKCIYVNDLYTGNTDLFYHCAYHFTVGDDKCESYQIKIAPQKHMDIYIRFNQMNVGDIPKPYFCADDVLHGMQKYLNYCKSYYMEISKQSDNKCICYDDSTISQDIPLKISKCAGNIDYCVGVSSDLDTYTYEGLIDCIFVFGTKLHRFGFLPTDSRLKQCAKDEIKYCPHVNLNTKIISLQTGNSCDSVWFCGVNVKAGIHTWMDYCKTVHK